MANRKVVMPLYNDCTLMDFAGATQVFAFAGFDVIWLAAAIGSVDTTEGVSVHASGDFNFPVDDTYILFIPGGGSALATLIFDINYIEFLQKAAEKAKWRGSVCSGVFLLAAANILRDCEATTYWSAIPALTLMAEKLNLDIPEGYPRYLVDEKKKIFTGGGISSSIDLALELVAEIDGVPAAQAAQLAIQYHPQPSVNAGDPSVAPQVIVEQARKDKNAAGFVKAITEAVLKLLPSL